MTTLPTDRGTELGTGPSPRPTDTQAATDHEAVRRDNQLLLDLPGVAPGATWTWSIGEDCVEWSLERYRSFGHDPAGFTFEEVVNCLDEEDRARAEIRMAAMIETGEPVSFVTPVRRADGSLRSIEVAATAPAVEGDVPGVVGTVPAVTECHEANVALRESEARYRMIVETTREGVWLIDAAGKTTFVNGRLADMLGYPVDEMIGQPLLDFFDDDGMQVAADSLGRMRDGVDVQFDFRFFRPDGTELWTLISASPIQDAEGTYLGALAMFTDITQRKFAEANLAHAATHDGLTGLPNRTLFVDRVTMAVARSVRQDTNVAVLFCDLDRFKVVNDSMGHDAGDRVLVAMAERLSAAVRPGDTVARVGGDEFGVCCEGLADGTEVQNIAARLGRALAEPVVVEGREAFVTASIGIRVATRATEPAGDLLRDADAAMYQAKQSGRACQFVFDESRRQEGLSRLEIESELHHALERGELRVRYQPTMSIAEGTMTGVEALLRWQHPAMGMLPPADFIGIAEEVGLIVPIGLWVLEQACQQLHDWNQDGAGPLTMAVNLSPRQLHSPELVSRVAEILRRTGVNPGDVCLEITETVLMKDPDAAEVVLGALKGLGVRLALDDFGTGYSSLGYLRRFPVDVIKIDRSFIANLGSDPEETAIVAAIVRLAQALDLQVVAEGVETAEQRDHLDLLGCPLAQGYYWSRPVAPNQLDAWLKPITPETGSTAARIDRKRTVLVADDEAQYRSTIKRILENSGRFNIVAEAVDGQMAVDLAERHHPDLVLLDLTMPKMGGLEALPRILLSSPATKVAILSGRINHDGNDPIAQGASAYLSKLVKPTQLIEELLLVTEPHRTGSLPDVPGIRRYIAPLPLTHRPQGPKHKDTP